MAIGKDLKDRNYAIYRKMGTDDEGASSGNGGSTNTNYPFNVGNVIRRIPINTEIDKYEILLQREEVLLDAILLEQNDKRHREFKFIKDVNNSLKYTIDFECFLKGTLYLIIVDK